jgi:cobalamin biosynthesis Mg chelatase CobN
VAVAQQTARQAQQQAAEVQAATNEFLYLLHNMKARSLPPGLAGAQSGSTDGQAVGVGARSASSNGGHSGSSGGAGTGTKNGSSSGPTTVNLVASQSKTASPSMTALLLGLLVLALVMVAIVAMRRNATRAGALVTSDGDDEGAE